MGFSIQWGCSSKSLLLLENKNKNKKGVSKSKDLWGTCDFDFYNKKNELHLVFLKFILV